MDTTVLDNPPDTLPEREAITPSGLQITVPSREDHEALPAWFRDRTAAAWKDFQKLPVPSVKSEPWRYSNAKRISLAELHPAGAASAAEEQQAIEQSRPINNAAARLVFVNDRLIHRDASKLPAGVVCVSLAEALRDHEALLKQHFMKRESFLGSAKFAALHLAHVKAGTVVFVPKDVVVDHPIEIFHWVTESNAAIFPHTLVVTADHAQVKVIDHYRSSSGALTLSCAVADIIAGAGSSITYVSCQELGEKGQALHLSSTATHRDSKVKNLQVQLGAEFSRSESVSDLVGEGSRSDMLSVSMPVKDQVVDQRTLQRHLAPHTYSDLLYKNALYDRARSIFSGLIHVFEGAHYTDAYQTCRNLLNSEEAEASSMPGLEINADQVKCSHGSTSSPVSDEELFYLKARGIPDTEARRLIVIGFLANAVSRLEDESIETMIRERMEEKFASLVVA